ncbi:uncharacterized protein PADG_01294 [Paracoccidioides brasiliensis Pb18]|uniref:Uncharacterized protein n=2 Tax=Paracoccidioides brasiliensis TaxID=121759 RepID=C1G2X8_PARBD|nr:uncharacterized protein PADG_01294 [Paracoccidioides brasiliensis Pb18]EEH45144.2 hypothetical protein PADG_01294 [Paracoccidioides brasiliensis Pb18]ODH25995.1 hypothetical protein ACO22_04885 [Paracoccidioides brasiliensis]ODH47882.1 hypothetical protein GX48_06001 [Paracoccidioides brasiliensis]
MSYQGYYHYQGRAADADLKYYPVSNEIAAFPPSRSSSGMNREYEPPAYRPAPGVSGLYHSSKNRTSPSWELSREALGTVRSPNQGRLNESPISYSNSGRIPITTPPYDRYSNVSTAPNLGSTGQQPRPPAGGDIDTHLVHPSHDLMMRDPKSPTFEQFNFFHYHSKRRAPESTKSIAKYHPQRRLFNRDEFDGPTQFLDMPSPRTIAEQEKDLPRLPTSLDVQEQDKILCEVNDRLARCAFNFVAKYRFPIPVEPDKRQVRTPADREWTEWVHLLKRLATKRRIPARVLYNGQIKQFVTVLENSLEMRHAAKHQSRPVKDDRNVLQLISAGTQVAKILKDASTMEYLDQLYGGTENLIRDRRAQRGEVFLYS